MSDTLHKLSVVIEGNNTKLSQAAREAIQDTRKMTDSINAELKKIQSPVEQLKKSSGGTDAATKKIREIMASIRNYNKEVQIAAGLKVYTDDYLRLGRDISSTEKELEKLRQKMAGMDESKRFVPTQEFKDLEKNIQSSQKALEKLNEQKGKKDKAGLTTEAYAEYEKTVERLDFLNKKLVERKKERDLLESKKGTSEYDKDKLAEIKRRINNNIASTRYVNDRLAELEKQGVSSESAKEYQQLVWEIERAEKKLKEYKDLRSQMLLDGSNLEESESFQKAGLAIVDAENKLRSYYATKRNMENSGQDVRVNDGLINNSYGAAMEAGLKGGMSDAVARIKEMRTELMNTIREIPVLGRVASEAAYIGSKAFGGLRSVFNKVTSGIKTAGGTFSSLIQRFRSGIPGINRTRSSMNGLGNAGKGLGGILRTVAMSAKFMFASFLIRGGMNAAKEGMQNLAQYSDRTNASLSMLMSGLTQVKNSLATAFAPVLDVITPILDTLINYVVAATNAIAQFFAALTGQGTYVRAVKVQQDYAASLGGTAAAANGANAAAKELQRTIMGFDEINKLDDNKGSSGGSGGGSGAGGLSPSDMFTTETVKNVYANFADKIKEAWQNADFTEIGTIFGEKIRDALNSIPWDEIQETARKIGKSIATFINGALETAGLAGSIGKTAAEAINTGIEGVNSFLTNLHWDSIGQFVADALNGFIGKANWSGAGTAVKNGLNGVFTAVETWANAFDFGQAGEAVKTAVNSALSGINWTKANTGAEKIGSGIATALNAVMTKDTFANVGKTIAGALNTVVSGAYSFIGTIDFKEWGKSIATGINNFFTTFDWKKAGLTFSTAVTGIISTLTSAISGTSWYNVGKSIADMIKGIDWPAVISGIGDLILSAIKGSLTLALGLADGLFGDIDWGFDDTTINFSNLQLNMKDLRKEIEDTNREIHNMIDQSDDWKTAGDDEARIAHQMADEYFKLKEKQTLSNDERDRMKDLAKKLVESYPELEKYYNDETGLIDATRGTVDQLIESHLREVKIAAAKEDLITLQKAYNDAVKNTEKAENALKYAEDQLNEATKLKNEYQDKANKGLTEWQMNANAVSTQIDNELTPAVWTAEESLADAKKTQDEANRALQEATGFLGDAITETDDYSESIDGIPEKKSTTVTADTKSALGNVQALAQEFSKLSFEAQFTLTTKGLDATMQEKIQVIAEVTGTDYSKMPVSEKTIDDCYAEIIKSYQSKGYLSPTLTAKGDITSAKQGYSASNSPTITTNGNVIKAEAANGVTVSAPVKANSIKPASSKVILSGISALAKSIAWLSGSDQQMIVKAATRGVAWTASAKADAGKRILVANALTRGINFAKSSNKNLLVAALTGGIGWMFGADKGLSGILGYVNKTEKQSGVSLFLYGITAIIESAKSAFSNHKANGGIYSNGKWQPVTAAANGGAFSTGQMFIAREAGPELVGSIGRSTAVMNNNQIVSSVSAGVYQAVIAAMSQSSGQGRPVNVSVVLEGDAKGIFKVVKQENDRIVLSTGHPALLT